MYYIVFAQGLLAMSLSNLYEDLKRVICNEDLKRVLIFGSPIV